VRIEPVAKPNATVNHNHDQNTSCRAIGSIQATVVIVVTSTGFKRDTDHSTIAVDNSIHLWIFLFILSTRTIASFTTIHIRDINQIHTGIDRGLPVIYNHMITQLSDINTE
jgi:hypothetical protein